MIFDIVDYGVRRDLRLFLENIEPKTNTVIVENKMNEKYPACQDVSRLIKLLFRDSRNQ